MNRKIEYSTILHVSPSGMLYVGDHPCFGVYKENGPNGPVYVWSTVKPAKNGWYEMDKFFDPEA